MSVRRAGPEDVDRLVPLSVGIQQLHVNGRPDLFRAPDEEALRAFLADRLTDAIVLISDDDGQPSGYLLAELSERATSPFRHASKTLYIHHIAVDPRSQRHGVGRQLLDEACAIGRAEGVDAVRLDSWAFNTDAHAFFEAHGFQPVNLVFERKPV